MEDPPRHNRAVPIRIKGHNLKDSAAYFISNQHTKKELNSNIHVLDGIYNSNGKLTLYTLVSNYTNKHVIFSKGQCIGHIGPPIHTMSLTSVNSAITQKMMDDQVELNTFTPDLHNLSSEVKHSIGKLLESFKSQFANKWNKYWHDEFEQNANQHRQLWTCHAETIPYWVKVEDEINKLLDVKVIHSSHSSWSAPIIIVPKGNGGNHLVISYRALNKVTQNFIWATPKFKDIFSKLDDAKLFSTLDLWAGYHHISLDNTSIPKRAFTSPFGKYEYLKVLFRLYKHLAYFQELMNKVMKDLPFTFTYLDDIIIYSKTTEDHLDHLQQIFHKFWNAKLSWNWANVISLPKKSKIYTIFWAQQV